MQPDFRNNLGLTPDLGEYLKAYKDIAPEYILPFNHELPHETDNSDSWDIFSDVVKELNIVKDSETIQDIPQPMVSDVKDIYETIEAKPQRFTNGAQNIQSILGISEFYPNLEYVGQFSDLEDSQYLQTEEEEEEEEVYNPKFSD